MEEISGFGMKNILTLPNLTNNYFESLRDEIDEPIYTHKDEYMRWFVRQSIKGTRCSALNQYYKSTISDELFNIVSEDVDINGNICEILKVLSMKINIEKK